MHTKNNPFFDDEDIEVLLDGLFEVDKELQNSVECKCECGAEKCGFATHSEWCPKHEPKK